MNVVVYQICAACNYAKPERVCTRVGQYWFCLQCFETGGFLHRLQFDESAGGQWLQ